MTTRRKAAKHTCFLYFLKMQLIAFEPLGYDPLSILLHSFVVTVICLSCIIMKLYVIDRMEGDSPKDEENDRNYYEGIKLPSDELMEEPPRVNVLKAKVNQLQQKMRAVMKHTKTIKESAQRGEKYKQEWLESDDKIKNSYDTLGAAGVQHEENSKDCSKYNFSGDLLDVCENDWGRYNELKEMNEILSGMLQYYEKRAKAEANQCYW